MAQAIQGLAQRFNHLRRGSAMVLACSRSLPVTCTAKSMLLKHGSLKSGVTHVSLVTLVSCFSCPRSDEYHKVALAGIEHKPELAGLDRAAFERSPPEAMRGLLRYVLGCNVLHAAVLYCTVLLHSRLWQCTWDRQPHDSCCLAALMPWVAPIQNETCHEFCSPALAGGDVKIASGQQQERH
jgi:hypothetical protein